MVKSTPRRAARFSEQLHKQRPGEHFLAFSASRSAPVFLPLFLPFTRRITPHNLSHGNRESPAAQGLPAPIRTRFYTLSIIRILLRLPCRSKRHIACSDHFLQKSSHSLPLSSLLRLYQTPDAAGWTPAASLLFAKVPTKLVKSTKNYLPNSGLSGKIYPVRRQKAIPFLKPPGDGGRGREKHGI